MRMSESRISKWLDILDVDRDQLDDFHGRMMYEGAFRILRAFAYDTLEAKEGMIIAIHKIAHETQKGFNEWKAAGSPPIRGYTVFPCTLCSDESMGCRDDCQKLIDYSTATNEDSP